MSLRRTVVSVVVAVVAVAASIVVLQQFSACTSTAPPDTATTEAVKEPTFHLTDAPIPGFPNFREDTSPALQLHLIPPSRVTLPEIKLPPKLAAITDEFVLEHEEMPNPKKAERELVVIRAPLPFPVTIDEQTFKPEGMEVRIDGVPIPFSRTPAPKAKRSTWRISNKFLLLTHETMPAPGAITVQYKGVLDSLVRHDPARSSLPPEKFIHYDVTVGGTTRHGLLLPAPTIAEWDVTLPDGPVTFEAWTALEAGPVDKPQSDGAAVSLSVVEGDQQTVVDRRELPAGDHEFSQWRTDLSRWAGKKVTLRLATETLEKAALDWVFVGSPSIWGPPKVDVRRVVVVALDTTRPDHLSLFGYDRLTTPEIDKWAANAVVFDKTWSTAPRTRPSFRSSTTGRLPLPAVGATNIGQVFQEHGFATQGIVANVHLQPRFDFDLGFDAWAFDGKATATDEVDRSLAWLDENQDRDTYLFVHFMDPHMVYDAPEPFGSEFVTDPDPTLPPHVRREQVLQWMHDKDPALDDRRKANLVGLHDGEIAYTSHELGRLFDEIDKMPGRTLVVLYSDHGEEFWEHGGFEHNHSLYDELVRTVLVMRPRGGIPEGHHLQAPVTLMDIAPTLYDLFGFSDGPVVDGMSLMGVMAGGPANTDRALPIGYLQYSHERWGVVWNGHKYVLHTGSGAEELYDLTADPDEKNDLSASMDLEPYRQKTKEAHGVPVGPGWRIALHLEPTDESLRIELPAEATAAGVLDPEAIVEHRANIEWGELPRKLPGDVGQATLAADKKSITFAPGQMPEGMLYVMFDTAQPAEGAKVELDGKALSFTAQKRGRVWRDGKRSVIVDPGTIVIPPPTEAELMGIGPSAAGTAADTKQLCALGYMSGPDCEGVDEETVGDEEPDAEAVLHVD